MKIVALFFVSFGLLASTCDPKTLAKSALFREETGYFLNLASGETVDKACNQVNFAPETPAVFDRTVHFDFANFARFFPNDPVKPPIELSNWMNASLASARDAAKLVNSWVPGAQADVVEVLLICGNEPCTSRPIRYVRVYSNVNNPFIYGGKGYLLSAGLIVQTLMRNDPYNGRKVIERDVALAFNALSLIK